MDIEAVAEATGATPPCPRDIDVDAAAGADAETAGEAPSRLEGLPVAPGGGPDDEHARDMFVEPTPTQVEINPLRRGAG